MEIEDLDVEEDREREIYLVTIKVYGKIVSAGYF